MCQLSKIKKKKNIFSSLSLSSASSHTRESWYRILITDFIYSTRKTIQQKCPKHTREHFTQFFTNRFGSVDAALRRSFADDGIRKTHLIFNNNRLRLMCYLRRNCICGRGHCRRGLHHIMLWLRYRCQIDRPIRQRLTGECNTIIHI